MHRLIPYYAFLRAKPLSETIQVAESLRYLKTNIAFVGVYDSFHERQKSANEISVGIDSIIQLEGVGRHLMLGSFNNDVICGEVMRTILMVDPVMTR